MPTPNLLFGPEGVERLARTVRHPRVASAWAALRAQALAEAAAQPPAVPGPSAPAEWGVISSFVGTTAGQLERLSLLALLEPGSGPAAACVTRIEALLAAPAWVDCCHAFAGRRFDLGVGHVTRALAVAADWLGDSFPDALRRRVEQMLRERAVEAFLADTAIPSNWWMLQQINNWVPVMCAGLAAMAVSFGGAIGDANALLARACHETGRYLRWVSPDGSVEEAGGYWAYGMSNALFVAEVARRHRGEDFYGLPQLRKTGYFPLYGSVLGEYVLNFGDTSRGGLPAAPSLRLAAEYRDPVLQWYAEQGSSADPLAILWWDPTLAPEPPARLPTSTAYPGGVEWAVLRTSLTDPDALVVGLRGGTNLAAHCHRDLNSVILHAFGRPLVADHGNLGYSRDYWLSQYGHLGRDTRGHNTVMPRGMEQIQRRTIPTMTDGEDLRGRSRISVFERGEGADYVVSEAVLSYGEGEGARRRLLSQDRHLALLAPGLVVLADEVSAAEPLELLWLFHAGGELQVEADGACFSCGEARLRLRLHGEAPAGMRCSLRSDQKLPYLEVATAEHASRALLVATLLPHRAGERPAEPVVEVRGTTVDVAWAGRRHRLQVAARRLEALPG